MKFQYIRFSLLILALILFSLPIAAIADKPENAVKFVILKIKPKDNAVGTPITVTVEAQKSNNKVDDSYQNDVTLITSGSATGGGLVDIVNGTGSLQINDFVVETVTLSLSDTEATGLDVSSTEEINFIDSGGPIGGGGGAEWTRQIPTTVTFSGRAFPNAKILVVDKDVSSENVVSQNIVTDQYGIFQVDFVGISQGLHSFGLLIKDKDNRTTQTKFFNIDVPANDLIVKDFLAPPTAGLLQRLVSRGQPLVVIGNASPTNRIIIEIDDIIKKEADLERDGSYKVAIDTGILEFGTHYVRVKQIDRSQASQQKRESDYSPTNAFVVSHLVLPKTDLSNDGLVDIKDWSIFLSNWVSEDESQRKIIDFNDDGKINISDFSIFIRTIKK